ncbi:hypothetical protein QTL95_09520 [Rhizobium sp. S152]|uniref:hypothetical protein n=1 Tax=Rhizobium sp. S152 TaxID=3055038 RepID=UPI0025A95B3B|nr:hypothetical protein [Rhizobium sp. S152]MDM9626136.1 hypothetical protein [Rhizobium sp. S152]
MTKLSPVTLVIADTGPLISLAVVDRLDLLQSFGAPVFVTDAVMYECTRLTSRPGADRLRAWFDVAGGNQHRIVKTPFGAAYLEALALEAQGIEGATKNFGEWATSWTMDNIDALFRDMLLEPGRHIGLIISDDKDYLNGRPPHAKIPPNTHVLSTRAFFVALEGLGMIASAEDLRESIRQSGRPQLAKSLIDRPFREVGEQSDYRQQMQDIRDRDLQRDGSDPANDTEIDPKSRR